MSHAAILEFGTDPRFKNITFPDLETTFEKHLEQVYSLADIDRLLCAIRPLFRDPRFSPEEIIQLKKLRQRAYDRKRHGNFQNSKPSVTRNRSKFSQPDMEKLQIGNTESSNSENDAHFYTEQQNTHAIEPLFWLRNALQPLAWLLTAGTVCFFLWHQSLALYRAAGFVSATYAAAGGIIMLIGFAAHHCITRSWLALLLCLYAGANEAYLMVSGTITDDKQIHADAVQNDPELRFLKEKIEKEKAHYRELQLRYENPESKVFQNEWFLKTFLNPAREAHAKAHEEYSAKKSSLSAASGDKQVLWLKIS